MTTNEAIKILTNIEAYLIAGNPIWDTDTIREAFDMAIEELEDCDGVADALNGYAELYRKLKEKYDNLKKQNQWRPCEERLPNEDGMYLTTIENILGKASVISGFRNGIWQTQFDVIAWMPKPKAYEGRTE